MRVRRVHLQDFRNYHDQSVELDPGLNLIAGSNAQGKTNLLEAVYYLGGLGSPRGPESVLVREGCERALVHATVERAARTVQVDVEIRPGRGLRALANKTPVNGTRALRELVTCVFFGPDELSLVKGGPDSRRRFSDELIVKLRPARDSLRRDFDRVLKQRNALLRSAPRGRTTGPEVRATLEVWDESFVRTGAALATARLEALGALAPLAAKRYEEVAGAGRLELGYASSWLPEDSCRNAFTEPGGTGFREISDALESGLAVVRDKEIERGQSLVGPQRDDITVVVATGSGDGSLMDARAYASQGDQRTCALALKLAEHDLLTEALRDEPVLLLDDVFSELDPSRRSWLADTVRHIDQTLLTSAEPNAVQAAAAPHSLTVVAGVVTRDE